MEGEKVMVDTEGGRGKADWGRLQKQIDFLMEVDKLKSVYRQTLLLNKSRNENSAEHSWHLALLALTLQEYANEKVDLIRVIKMMLIHDIVEIDAGDTFAYDTVGSLDKEERETKAANRLFGMLPDEQKQEMLELWREFEDRVTPEAKFAAGLDRLHPMLHNYYTDGAAWKKHGITRDRVIQRNSLIEDGSEALWEYAQRFIQDAVDKGILPE